MAERPVAVAARALLRRFWAEALVAAGGVLGWVLLTWGIARLTVTEVWPISAGLLFLSLCGWKFLGVLVLEGLYTLTRPGERG